MRRSCCCRTITRRAETVPESDARIKTENLSVDAGGTKIDGYLAKPANGTAFPTRHRPPRECGLNPHIKDVTRALAVAGFLAYGVDLLTPLGGTPSDEDKARDMIGQLKGPGCHSWLKASMPRFGSARIPTARFGVVGFCWVEARSTARGHDPNLNAAVAYYGKQPDAARCRRSRRRCAALRRPGPGHRRRHSGLRGRAQGEQQEL